MGLDRLDFEYGWVGDVVSVDGKKGSISHGETLFGLWTVDDSSHWTLRKKIGKAYRKFVTRII